MKAKDARPIVKKYIAHDFLSELENDDRKCAEHSGQEKSLNVVIDHESWPMSHSLMDRNDSLIVKQFLFDTVCVFPYRPNSI